MVEKHLLLTLRLEIRIRTIQGFLALTAGLASDEQAAELVKQLTDPSLFWSKYQVTT